MALRKGRLTNGMHSLKVQKLSLFVCEQTLQTMFETGPVSLTWVTHWILNVTRMWPSLIKVEAYAETYILGMTKWLGDIPNVTCKSKAKVDASYS